MELKLKVRYIGMFIQHTWGVFSITLGLWCLMLAMWVGIEPPFAKDLAEFSIGAATDYRRVFDRAKLKIRNLWFLGGGCAVTAYGLTAGDWPNLNWTSKTLVPLLRVLAGYLIGTAFGQAADLTLSGGPILGRIIKSQGLEMRLGKFGPPLIFFLRNVNVVLAVMIVVFSLAVGYEGGPSEMVLSIAAALAVSRYMGNISSVEDGAYG